jgi:hypothetical protein
VRRGLAPVGCFKGPAWPDLVASVQHRHSVYVHFPLEFGSGRGDAMAHGEPTDWTQAEG